MKYLVLLLSLLSPLVGAEKDVIYPTYPVTAWRVIDGDTIETTLNLGFRLTKVVYARPQGIDTPELSGDSAEAGRAVSMVVGNWLADNKPVSLKYIKQGKFGGRVICDIQGSSGETLSHFLLRHSLAKPYDGGTKDVWTKGELTTAEVKSLVVTVNRNKKDLR